MPAVIKASWFLPALLSLFVALGLVLGMEFYIRRQRRRSAAPKQHPP